MNDDGDIQLIDDMNMFNIDEDERRDPMPRRNKVLFEIDDID